MIPIPDFTRGEGLLKPDHMLAETLKQGLGTMPAYQGLLSEHELADVITYTRTLQ
jgi:mono/diheme cytochrome c family protein